MKKILYTLYPLIFLLAQCQHQYVTRTVFEEKKVSLEREELPLHIGEPKIGRYGDYSYNIYKDSMQIAALNAGIAVYFVEVFDTDNNGTYDLVFIIKNGNSYKTSSKSQDAKTEILSYITLANIIKKRDEQAVKDYFSLTN